MWMKETDTQPDLGWRAANQKGRTQFVCMKEFGGEDVDDIEIYIEGRVLAKERD